MYEARKSGKHDAETRTVHINLLLLCNNLPIIELEVSDQKATGSSSGNKIQRKQYQQTQPGKDHKAATSEDLSNTETLDLSSDEAELDPESLREIQKIFESRDLPSVEMTVNEDILEPEELPISDGEVEAVVDTNLREESQPVGEYLNDNEINDGRVNDDDLHSNEPDVLDEDINEDTAIRDRPRREIRAPLRLNYYSMGGEPRLERPANLHVVSTPDVKPLDIGILLTDQNSNDSPSAQKSKRNPNLKWPVAKTKITKQNISSEINTRRPLSAEEKRMIVLERKRKLDEHTEARNQALLRKVKDLPREKPNLSELKKRYTMPLLKQKKIVKSIMRQSTDGSNLSKVKTSDRILLAKLKHPSPSIEKKSFRDDEVNKQVQLSTSKSQSQKRVMFDEKVMLIHDGRFESLRTTDRSPSPEITCSNVLDKSY